MDLVEELEQLRKQLEASVGPSDESAHRGGRTATSAAEDSDDAGGAFAGLAGAELGAGAPGVPAPSISIGGVALPSVAVPRQNRAPITSAAALVLNNALRLHEVFAWHTGDADAGVGDLGLDPDEHNDNGAAAAEVGADDAEMTEQLREGQLDLPARGDSADPAHSDDDAEVAKPGSDDGHEAREREAPQTPMERAMHRAAEIRLELMLEPLRAVFRVYDPTSGAIVSDEETIGRIVAEAHRAEALVPHHSDASWPLAKHPQGIFNVARKLWNDAPATRRFQLHLELPHATSVASRAVAQLRHDSLDTCAWQTLLQELIDTPIMYSRHVWQCFLFFFPTSIAMVRRYVEREVQELLGQSRDFTDQESEWGSFASFTNRVRILNTFFAHLTLCRDVALYSQFFDFADRFVPLNELVHEKVFQYALNKQVGRHPDSTRLWLLYMRWRSPRIRDYRQRTTWQRKCYQDILRRPISHTHRSEYDVLSEYRAFEEKNGSRHKPDESQFSRADKEFHDRAKLYSALPEDPLLHNFFPRPMRPLPREDRSCDGDEFSSTADVSDPHLSLEWRTWLLFNRILQQERTIKNGAASEAARVTDALRLRIVYFPHQLQAWLELADHLVHGVHPGTDRGRRIREAQGVFQSALQFHPNSLLLHFAFADFLLAEVGDVAQGRWTLRSLALRLTSRFHDCAMDLIVLRRRDPPEAAGDACRVHHLVEARVVALMAEHVEHVCSVYIHWLRWARLATRRDGEAHMRLVARHAVHTVRLPRLLQLAVRLCCAPGVRCAPTPSVFLRHFHRFCAAWASCEMSLSRDPQTAAIVVESWLAFAVHTLCEGLAAGRGVCDVALGEGIFVAAAEVAICDPQLIPRMLAALLRVARVLPHPQQVSLRVTQAVLGALRRATVNCEGDDGLAAEATSGLLAAVLDSEVVDGLQEWRWLLQAVTRLDPSLTHLSSEVGGSTKGNSGCGSGGAGGDDGPLAEKRRRLDGVSDVDLIRSAAVLVDPLAAFSYPAAQREEMLKPVTMMGFASGLVQASLLCTGPSAASGIPPAHASLNSVLASAIPSVAPEDVRRMFAQAARHGNQRGAADGAAVNPAHQLLRHQRARVSEVQSRNHALGAVAAALDIDGNGVPHTSQTLASLDEESHGAGNSSVLAAASGAFTVGGALVGFDCGKLRPHAAQQRFPHPPHGRAGPFDRRQFSGLGSPRVGATAGVWSQSALSAGGDSMECLPSGGEVADLGSERGANTTDLESLDRVTLPGGGGGAAGANQGHQNLTGEGSEAVWGDRRSAPVALGRRPRVAVAQGGHRGSLQFVLDVYALRLALRGANAAKRASEASGQHATREQRREQQTAFDRLVASRAAVRSAEYSTSAASSAGAKVGQLQRMLTEYLPPAFVAPTEFSPKWLVARLAGMESIPHGGSPQAASTPGRLNDQAAAPIEASAAQK